MVSRSGRPAKRRRAYNSNRPVPWEPTNTDTGRRADDSRASLIGHPQTANARDVIDYVAGSRDGQDGDNRLCTTSTTQNICVQHPQHKTSYNNL